MEDRLTVNAAFLNIPVCRTQRLGDGSFAPLKILRTIAKGYKKLRNTFGLGFAVGKEKLDFDYRGHGVNRGIKLVSITHVNTAKTKS